MNGGTFTKTGGVITGYANDPINGNVVTEYNYGTILDNQGHAVFVESGSKRRESTAGPDDNLDSSVAGSAGGWQ